MQTILGQLQVQKQDYAYTLQGWLKGINPTMGGTLTNGTGTTEAFPVTQDVYGFSLHYYKNDYKAIGYAPQATSVLGALTTNAASLYNGNIAAMAVNISQLSATKVYNYHYDQLNRIVAMDMYNGLNPNTGTFTPAGDTSYKERVSYDPNGNILGYLRNGDAGKTMDSLNYKYYSATNKLSQVTDNVPATKYSTDIDNQGANNYNYDPTGNMISAASDTITNITWNVYGKIATITKNGKQIKYTYDASGNRIIKQTAIDTTAYVRDATGNVMSVYYKPAGGSLVQSELHLYGSSRLGMATQHLVPDTSVLLKGGFANGLKSIFTRGEKFFELSNHLGNVLATVSDRRIQVDANSDGTVDSYKADIISANDYYPFGMLMPGRKYSIANTNYRYGFNGKENDKEISSTTTYDYGFRIYSPALGKFLSVDPLTKSYPWNSTYAFAENDVLRCIDVDGLEKYFVINYWKKGVKQRTEIEAYRDIDSKQIINMQFKLSNAPLTDKDVVIYDVNDEGTKNERISQSDESQLTNEQKSIFSKAFTIEKIKGGKTTIENELDNEVTGEDFSTKKGLLHLQASKNYFTSVINNSTGKSINKKTDLTPGIGTDVNMMAHDIYGDNKIHAGNIVDNGNILMGDKSSQGLKNLVKQIKMNGGVPRVNITGEYNYVPSTSKKDAITIQKGINNFSRNLIKILKAAGAKYVNVEIKVGTSSNNTGFRHVEANY